MTVEELYAALSEGELSGQGSAVEASGTIKEKVRPKIIRLANDALLRLHTHFFIREGSIILALSRDTKRYPLKPGNPAITDKDFVDDVIKIHAVYDVFGQPLPLNDSTISGSLSTVGNKTLLVPEPEKLLSVNVVYQAKHEPLIVDHYDQEIQLPFGLEEAFLAYIVARYLADVGTENALTRSAQHMARFQAVLDSADHSSWLDTHQSSNNSKFRSRGWI